MLTPLKSVIRMTCIVTTAAALASVAWAQTDSSSTSPEINALVDGSLGGGAPAGGGTSTHHGDWKQYASSHWAGEIGAGFSAPTNASSPYITWGGGLTLGGGAHLNKYVTLLAEYQFDDNKLPGALIAETGANGGYAHTWSLTLNPVIDLMPKRVNSFYVTGGGGFYRKVTSFTDPSLTEYCDYYYGYCGVDTSNVVVGHFSSNQGGWNVGAGVTHRLGGKHGRTQLYAEARYLFVDTPGVTSNPNGLDTTTVASGTSLIPVRFGVRF